MKRIFLILSVCATACIREGGSNPQVRPETPQTVAAPSVAAPPVVNNAPTPAPAVAPAQPAADVRHFGAPITMAETTRLPDLMQNAASMSGRTIRTEGTVAAVCQEMGCWMEIRDESAQVHIRMHGHSFFIPRDAQGRHARVQATVIAANPQGHCEQEAQQQTGTPVARLELDATGVDLL